jgi:hypothetical protein
MSVVDSRVLESGGRMEMLGGRLIGTEYFGGGKTLLPMLLD